jgi:hypothetical protein
MAARARGDELVAGELLVERLELRVREGGRPNRAAFGRVCAERAGDGAHVVVALAHLSQRERGGDGVRDERALDEQAHGALEGAARELVFAEHPQGARAQIGGGRLRVRVAERRDRSAQGALCVVLREGFEREVEG